MLQAKAQAQARETPALFPVSIAGSGPGFFADYCTLLPPLNLASAKRGNIRQSAKAGLAYERKVTKAICSLLDCEILDASQASKRYATGALHYQALSTQSKSKPIALIQPNYGYRYNHRKTNLSSIDRVVDSIEPEPESEPERSANPSALFPSSSALSRCIPDLVLIIPSPSQLPLGSISLQFQSPLIIVIEIKLTWTLEARNKLRQLYLPLTSILFGANCIYLDLVIVKSMSADALQPQINEKAEAGFASALSQPKPLLQWLGFNPLGF